MMRKKFLKSSKVSTNLKKNKLPWKKIIIVSIFIISVIVIIVFIIKKVKKSKFDDSVNITNNNVESNKHVENIKNDDYENRRIKRNVFKIDNERSDGNNSNESKESKERQNILKKIYRPSSFRNEAKVNTILKTNERKRKESRKSYFEMAKIFQNGDELSNTPPNVKRALYYFEMSGRNESNMDAFI